MEKKLIYLDQFAVSNISQPISHEWKEIRNLLLTLVEEQKAFCPIPFEHYLETSMGNDTIAINEDIILNELSDGRCILPQIYTTTAIINNLMRNQAITPELFLTKSKSNLLNNNEAITEFKKVNFIYESMNTDVLYFANEIRKVGRKNTPPKLIQSKLFNSILCLEINKFCSRIEDLFKHGYIQIRGIKTQVGEIPDYVDTILEYLFRHYKFTPEEFIKFYHELKLNGFENISTLNIRTKLSAISTVLNKKTTQSDEIDFNRIASSLQVANILLTDKKRKQEIIDLKLDVKYDCLILSGQNEDLKTFVDYLTKIKK